MAAAMYTIADNDKAKAPLKSDVPPLRRVRHVFMTSLVNLARETRIALHEYDHFSSS